MKRPFLPALILLLAAILLVPTAAGQAGPARTPAPDAGKKPKKSPLTRIGVVGASVSAGFGTGINLAAVIDKAVKIPHKVIDASSSMVFMDPLQMGKTFAGRLEKERVTAVIGLDFFFWYSYGTLSTEERCELLKKGCKLAARFKCPFIAGDIPDMRDAVGKMLHADQVPSREELKALNKQLREWAAKHSNVRIVPLSAWIDSLKKELPIAVDGRTRTFKKADLLAKDNLHATRKGLALLAIKSLEALANAFPGANRRDMVLDFDALAKTVAGKEGGKGKKAGDRDGAGKNSPAVSWDGARE